MFSMCRDVSYIIIFSQLSAHYLRTVQCNDEGLRIMGGRNATRGEFSYVMRMEFQIRRNNKPDEFLYICTCSLINPTWSLTAGHCIQGTRERLVASKRKAVIRYDLSTAHGTSISPILSFVLYPNYKYIGRAASKIWQILHDIGLVRSEAIPLYRYAKISSVYYPTLVGHKVLALGYGLTTGAVEGVYNIPDKLNKSLQVLDVIVVHCYDDFNKVTPGFCINGPCWQWATNCRGDSGGPILHPSGIVGIHSAGESKNCNRARALSNLNELSGYSTSTSPYIDWISNTIKL